MSSYERLIFLANETDTQSTPQKISELNELLSSQDVNDIKDCDLQILDDLISILSNTDNLFAEKQESIINLQENIRSRIYQ
jgi:hypothetical protein